MNDIHLKAPIIKGLPTISDKTRRVENLIRERDRKFKKVSETFGLEVRYAHHVRSGDITGRLAVPSASWPIIHPSAAEFMLRPCVEPIYWFFWEDFRRGGISEERFLKLSSALSGRPNKYSGKQGRTTPLDGHPTTYFEDVELSSQWRVRYLDLFSMDLHPLHRAIISYAIVILAHPLLDGNGRCARALLVGALAHAGLLNNPSLPLGPSFYVNSSYVSWSLNDLSETGNWSAYASRMEDLLSITAQEADTVS